MKHILTLSLLFACLSLFAQGTIVSVEQQATTPAIVLNIALPISAPYSVANYKVTYTTTDPFGQLDTVTGLLALPVQEDLVLPLVVYNHGTVQNRNAVPSVEGVQERLLVAGLATSSFITLAPDYLGLGDSDGIHPYLHAATQASAGRDMILAVQTWLDEQNIRYNDELFVTGYSQGGHASMALHRDLEQNPGDDGLTVTAAAHLSGPYQITAPSPQILVLRTVEPNLLGFFLQTAISYNYVYNLYGSTEDFIQEPYLGPVQQYYNDEIDLAVMGFKVDSLLQVNDAFLSEVFTDAFTNDVLNDDPELLAAYADNTVLNWAPQAPTLLYYCNGDEVVPPANSLLAEMTMSDLGADSLLLEDGGNIGHGACAIPAAVRTVEFFSSLARVFPVSLGRPAVRPDVSLVPNPVRAGSEVSVSGLPARPLAYELYDFTGRVIQRGLTGADGTVVIPTTVKSGPQVLRIALGDGTAVVRRLIVR